MRAGYARALFGPLLPVVPGREFAGTVVRVGGAARSGLAPGDRVFGVLPPAGEAGAYAEFVAARSDDVALTPPGWTHEARARVLLAPRPRLTPDAHAAHAVATRAGGGCAAVCGAHCVARARLVCRAAQGTACLCNSGAASLTACRCRAQGESLLVLGAGGAVGGAAVQLARAWGCRVHATARPRSAARVAALGAESVADADAPLRDEARRLGWPAFDAALDTVGGAASEDAAAQLLRPHAGRLVTLHGGMVNAMDRRVSMRCSGDACT
jgi:NADPH:quinone reductase-like Zn-dependent oxidoreductase